MKKLLVKGLIITCGFMLAAPVLADHVTLSGLFQGSEPTIAPFTGTCPEPAAALAYQEIGPVRVGTTGLYDVADAGDQVAVNVVIRFYEGSFDPQDVQANLVASSVDVADQLPLNAGVNYVIVIQHWCENREGAYGIALSGQGDITGTGVVKSPAYTIGTFKSTDPVADFGGLEPTLYNVHGPIVLPVTGTYHYSDLSVNGPNAQRVDMELWIYEGSFNPADPGENSVAYLDDNESVKLLADTEYYFVTTPWNENEFGEWHFVLFPPGASAMNLFFEGAWNNADTVGQGVLIDVLPTVFEDAAFLFLAWFTFDELPPITQSLESDATPQAVGDSTQRWLTAFGTYREGASRVELSFENTFGGVFNSAVPEPDQDSAYGTGALVAHDCNDVTLEFDLPAGPGEGSTRMGRSAPDPLKLDLCEELGQQAGVIE